MRGPGNLFLLNLQYNHAILKLEACSAQDNFFLIQLALQAGDIHLYIDYIATTTLSTTTDPDQYSSRSSSNLQDDLFSNNDQQSFYSFTTYYSDNFYLSSGSSWGSGDTLVSQCSLLFTESFSDVGDFSDYIYTL